MAQPTTQPSKALKDRLAASAARREDRIKKSKQAGKNGFFKATTGIPLVDKAIKGTGMRALPGYAGLQALKTVGSEALRGMGAVTEGTFISQVGGPFEKETGTTPIPWGKALERGAGPLGFLPTTKEEALFGKFWASPEWGRAKPESVEATKDIARTALLGNLKDPETRARLGRSYKDLWQGFESRPMSEQLVLGAIDPVAAAITAPAAAIKGLKGASALARGARRFVTPKVPVPTPGVPLPLNYKIAPVKAMGDGVPIDAGVFGDFLTAEKYATSPMQDMLTDIPGRIRDIPGRVRDIPGRVRDMPGQFVEDLISSGRRVADEDVVTPGEAGRGGLGRGRGRGVQVSDEARETLGEQVARGFRAYPEGIARGVRKFTQPWRVATSAEELERAKKGTDFSWAGEFATDAQLLKVQKLADILRKAKTLSANVVARKQAVERKEFYGEGMKAAEGVTGAKAKARVFLSKQAREGKLRVGALDHEGSIWTLDEFNTPAKREQFLEEVLGQAGVFGDDPSRARLQGFEHTNAINALDELMESGTVPTNSEALLLERVFGGDFAKAIISKRPLRSKMGDLFRDIINMPRANISSFDLSFMLRQGGMMFPSHLADVRASTAIALRVMLPGGEQVARRLQYEMMSMDNGSLWNKYINKGGLFQHRLGPLGEVAEREEAFLSHMAGRFLPWVGASERGYATFLNKLRWDVMDDMVKRVEATLPAGQEISDDQLKAIGSYLNSMTGRGPMLSGRNLDMLSTVMNAFMFSPRLFTSRIAAPINALKYTIGPRLPGQVVEGLPEKTNFIYSRAIAGDPAARAAYQEMSSLVAKQMSAWLITGGTIMFMAKLAQDSGAPVQVTVDPRSSDFGKIRAGNTRYDIWSGYSQIARAMASSVSGEIVSSQTGELRPISQWDNIAKFAKSKFSPTIGLARDYNLDKPLRLVSRDETTPRYGIGQGYFGEDRDILEDIQNWKGFLSADEESFWTDIFTPLFIRDVAAAVEDARRPFDVETDLAKTDVYKDHPSLVKPLGVGDIGASGWGSIAGAAVGGALGLGVQTYRTTDDVARAVTADHPGGPKDYLLLHGFEQDDVEDVKRRYEESRGITRTQGFSAELDRIKAREQSNMADLSSRAADMMPSEVRERYQKIRDEARISKQQAIRSEYGETEDPRRKELKKAQMSPSRKLVQDFYDMQDREKERRGVTSLGPEEYQKLLGEWETAMSRKWTSGDSAGIAAIYALRMNSHRVEIPDVILQKLSRGTRQNYESARKLRDLYSKGDPELRNLFKWEEQMYTTQ